MGASNGTEQMGWFVHRLSQISILINDEAVTNQNNVSLKGTGTFCLCCMYFC